MPVKSLLQHSVLVADVYERVTTQRPRICLTDSSCQPLCGTEGVAVSHLYKNIKVSY